MSHVAKAAVPDDAQVLCLPTFLRSTEEAAVEMYSSPPMGKKTKIASSLTVTPFTNKNIGGPSELLFFNDLKGSDGNHNKTVFSIKMSGVEIIEKRYLFSKGAPSVANINKNFLENELKASMVSYNPNCDVKFLRLGQASDQFQSNAPPCDDGVKNPATVIFNCTGVFYTATKTRVTYCQFKQSRVTSWPENFKSYLRKDKPCGYT
ncbi:uncharacterized protein LOC131927603 [Physella acuta]|uniref:uncharacterized protein LOC131927603 n=1 Tax=Physella acuta TaxID=109671 RepID=UPI0027DC8269|nr:uncharacterized protein LOC131927603 [Physella acuta]